MIYKNFFTNRLIFVQFKFLNINYYTFFLRKSIDRYLRIQLIKIKLIIILIITQAEHKVNIMLI